MKQVKQVNLNSLISSVLERREAGGHETPLPKTGAGQHETPALQTGKHMKHPCAPPDLLPWDAAKTMEDCRRQFARIACRMASANLPAFELAYDGAVLDARRRFPDGPELAARVLEFLKGWRQR